MDEDAEFAAFITSLHSHVNQLYEKEHASMRINPKTWKKSKLVNFLPFLTGEVGENSN